ncbi:hypothetical protein PPS11_27351 [Pseudomonas putida S11]|nr:hypothetical protein PPS11_27351 [Pseudomonas putida S11]
MLGCGSTTDSVLTRVARLLGALLTVDHVVTGDLLLAGAHQGQFDLVLDFFDVDGATRWHATLERGGDLLGQARDGVVDARRSGGGAAFNCEERLGDGHGDLVVGVGDDSAVTLDHTQLAGSGGGQILVGIGGLRHLGLRGSRELCRFAWVGVSTVSILFRRLLGAHRSVHLLDGLAGMGNACASARAGVPTSGQTQE